MIIELNETNAVDFHAVVRDISQNMRDIDHKELSALSNDESPDYFARGAEICPGRKFVALHDNVGVAVGGLADWYSGVGVMWLWATDDFEKVAKGCTKTGINLIKDFFENGGHRIECLTAANHSNVHAWLELLGLEFEHIKKACGKNKEDYYMYSKVV